MGEMRHVIIHYHIFKNAGSTLAAALERNFGNCFAYFDAPRYDKRIQPTDLIAFVEANPQVAVISSHHLRPPAPQLEGVQFEEILILRNPLDRLRSMYEFYRRTAVNQDPLTLIAKKVPMAQFFEHLLHEFPNMVTNAQLNLVANGGGRIPDQEDARRAASMLKRMTVVGVAEMFDECAVAAEYSLRPFFPHLDLSYRLENVSPGRLNTLQSRLQQFASKCGDGLYRRIEQANQLDAELVDAAASELGHRLDGMGFAQVHRREFSTRVTGRQSFDAGCKRPLLLRVRKGAARLLSSLQGSPIHSEHA